MPTVTTKEPKGPKALEKAAMVRLTPVRALPAASRVPSLPEEAMTSDRETVAADGEENSTGPDGEPRRGWWQRPFGN